MKSFKSYLQEEWSLAGNHRDVYGTNDPRAVAELKALPQPITVNGGSYSYSADVTKTPVRWVASDGDVVDGARTIRSIAAWMDSPEDYLGYLDGEFYLEDMIQDRVIRPGKELMGDSVDPALTENAEELNIGDDVIITGPVEFKGSTGVIADFDSKKAFVVVNLYNHGKHSFHSSDVSFNEYADSDEEEADMYDRGQTNEAIDAVDKFKVGDDVRVADTYAQHAGEVGTVVSIEHAVSTISRSGNSSTTYYYLEFAPGRKAQKYAEESLRLADDSSPDEPVDSLADIRRLSGLK